MPLRAQQEVRGLSGAQGARSSPIQGPTRDSRPLQSSPRILTETLPHSDQFLGFLSFNCFPGLEYLLLETAQGLLTTHPPALAEWTQLYLRPSIHRWASDRLSSYFLFKFY